MAQIILDSNSNLIQGDFDSATVNNRTKLQTSTTNATTGVYVVPNGSATSASVQIANAADPTNASKVVVATNASTDTQIVSGANGSGSYLPLSFYTNNDIRFQMGNAGELNVRTAPGTVSSGTSGQFLTSGGPGAGVSWTTAAAGGFSNMDVFNAPGTWTNPGTVTKVKVTVIGGGGAGSGTTTSPSQTTGGTGGTSSFGAYCSATGGSGGPPGAGGVGSNGQLNIRGATADSSFGAASLLGQGGVGATAGLYGSGGGATNYNPTPGSKTGGGGGGSTIEVISIPTSPVAVTVGSGGAVGPGSWPAQLPGIGGAGVVIVEY
jgi:hypothetical protein